MKARIVDTPCTLEYMPRVVLGVSGGIAAYKSCHVVRLLRERGVDVVVVPTPSALNFVGAATFEALSGHPVSTEVFDNVAQVQHVGIGQGTDLVLIAPATADVLARLVAGRADDQLTATCLVATCPIIVCPAMHTEMWLNPATQENVATLRRRGIIVMEPAHGRLTGRDSGTGRLPEPSQIAEFASYVMEIAEHREKTLGRTAARERGDMGAFPQIVPRDMEGMRVVVSAGGTHEPIDPVRFIGNESSGKQGWALAQCAAQRGAEVTVVAGAVIDMPIPCGATVRRVTTARQMEQAVMEASRGADIVVMAAAVADYRPATCADSKLKKTVDGGHLASIELVENPDILAGLAAWRDQSPAEAPQVLIGFAAETGDAEHTPLEFGRQKCQRKNVDALMVNHVGADEHGNERAFGTDVNEGWIVTRDGAASEVPRGSKLWTAHHIWDCAVRIHVEVAGVEKP